MECRICLDETPPFLQNICACRGTQGAIHAACLNQWIAQKRITVCDICKEPFRIALLPTPHLPFGYRILFSNGFVRTINWLFAALYVFSTSPLLFLQQLLCVAYAISYTSLLRMMFRNPYYFLHWFRIAIMLPTGHFIFPLPALVLFWLPTQVPLLITTRLYREIWRTHVGILEYMRIQ
jgi:hypothetical protein